MKLAPPIDPVTPAIQIPRTDSLGEALSHWDGYIPAPPPFEHWTIFSEDCGLPQDAELRGVVEQAQALGLSWMLYAAEYSERLDGPPVETIVLYDLAWQSGHGALRSGNWDDGARIMWMEGGTPIDLTGQRLEYAVLAR